MIDRFLVLSRALNGLDGLWVSALWMLSCAALGGCLVWIFLHNRWREGIAGQREKERRYERLGIER